MTRMVIVPTTLPVAAAVSSRSTSGSDPARGRDRAPARYQKGTPERFVYFDERCWSAAMSCMVMIPTTRLVRSTTGSECKWFSRMMMRAMCKG